MAWAQLIGAGISAWSSHKANKDNMQGQKDAFKDSLDAVQNQNVSGGWGDYRKNPDGSSTLTLADKYQEESDWALEDAAANKGWLSQYQQGGPAAAAETLFNQRVDPLRRQQAREQALFDEQAKARGMLGATETGWTRGQNTRGYQEAEAGVYNQSYMDVQDIIDRYRNRISTGVSESVNIEGLPMDYFNASTAEAGNKSGVAQKGLEALSGGATQKAESYSKFGNKFGNQIANNKFGFNGLFGNATKTQASGNLSSRFDSKGYTPKSALR